MHAAKPAAAIEQATVGDPCKHSLPARVKSSPLTSNFSLTATFRSRYRATTFEQHPDRLKVHLALREEVRWMGRLTAAVNKKVVMDF